MTYTEDMELARTDWLLQQAVGLREEKVALLQRIDINRQDLRKAVTAGYASEEQAIAIAEWYPWKGRGGAVEDEDEDAGTVDGSAEEVGTEA